jgi:hypothetical protein
MNIKDIITESQQACPHCGGPLVEYSGLMEKKDACYYKVKASAKVWPSAYASGRLVQCRKKGAANYGNKSEGVAEAGPFSYGAKNPRKGSVASNAEQKRKQQDQGKQPIEPRDQMVGVAKVKQGVAEGMSSSQISKYAEELVATTGYKKALDHAIHMAELSRNPEWLPVIRYIKSIKPAVAEGSGPKEKQKTPYRDINSPEYKAAADKQKQRMDKDKAAEPGKKMLSKQGVTEDEEVRLGGMTRAERESRFRSRKQDLLQDYALLGKLTTDIIRAINNEVFLTKEQIIDFYKQQIEDPDLTALEYAHDNNIPSSGLLKGVLRYLAQRGFSMLDIRKLMGKAAEQKKKDTLALPPPGPNEGVMEDAYRYGAGGEWDKRNMKAKNPEIERDLKAFKVWINGGPSTSLGPGGLTSIIDGVQTYFERINPTDDAAVAKILQSIFKSTIGQLRTIKPPPMWAQYLNPVLDAAIKEPMNQGTPAAPAARTAPALGEPPAAPAAPGGAPAAPAAPAAKKFNTANATDVTPRSVTPVAPPRIAAPMMRLRERDIEEGRDDRGFFNNVEQWHEAKSDIEHDDQWETSKFIVVKNNGKTVAKWSKADNYGWVDSSQQEVAEVNEDVAAINAQRDRAINHVAAARELAEARRMTPKQTAKPQTIVTETAQPVMAPKAVVSRSLNSLLKSAGLKQK